MKLVKSRLRDRYWVEDDNGKRITDKFYRENIKKYGPIIYICILQSFAITPNGLLIYPSKITNIDDRYYSVFGYMNNKVKRLTYDHKGDLLSDNLYLYSHSEGLIAAQKNTVYGFMDGNLSWVIKPQFLSVKQPFILGKAIVEISKDKCVVINKKGEYVGEPFDCNHTMLIQGDNPTFLIDTGKGRGVIDLEGNILIPPIYHDIEKVGDYYKVIQNRTYGLTDAKGNTLLDCKYTQFDEHYDRFIAQEYGTNGFYNREILK